MLLFSSKAVLNSASDKLGIDTAFWKRFQVIAYKNGITLATFQDL
jgi:hypothetical protein